MRGPLLLGPRPVAARRGVGGSSIRILGVAAVALALLTLWRGLYLRDDDSSDVTERGTPRTTRRGRGGGGARYGEESEGGQAFSAAAQRYSGASQWEHKLQHHLGGRADVEEDEEDDDAIGGRGRRHKGGHRHHSSGHSRGSVGTSRDRHFAAAEELTASEMEAMKAEEVRNSLGGAYREQRAWEIGQGEREDAMMEDNLLGNLQAAGMGGSEGRQGPEVGEEGAYDPIVERGRLAESARRGPRHKPREIGEFKEIKSVDRARPLPSPKTGIQRSREKDWGWRCSHLNECDEFKKQVEKQKAQAEASKEKKPDPSTVAERNAGMRTWGAAVARVAAMGQAAACQPAGLAIPQGESSGLVNKVVDDVDNNMSGVLRAVRDCCRFVLAKHRFIGMEELTLRSEVAALMGIAMDDAVMRTLRQELRHVTRGTVEVIVQGFERWQAGEPVNPSKTDVVPKKPLTRQEKQRKAERADAEYAAQQAAKTEAHVRTVERSWGASRMDDQLGDQLWAVLDGVRGSLRFRAGMLAGRRHHIGRRGELSNAEVADNLARQSREAMEQTAAGKASDPAPLPLSLNLGLFMHPGEQLSDLDSRRSLEPVLSVERQGSVGTAVHEYKFPPAMLDVLPETDRAWRFSTCAVVGNSGMLLKGERLGTVIDSADAVFRLNFAPTRTYEKYVGSKTTFDVVNLRNTELLLEGKQKATRLINSTMVVFEVTAPAARDTLYLDLLRRFSGMDLNHGHVVVLSPQLVSQILQVWGQMRSSFESLAHAANMTHAFTRRPDTGFFATMAALQMCEHVHLYGMSNWRPGSEQRYHYFTSTPDMLQGAGKARSFTFTREVLRAMALWPNSDAHAALTLHKP